MALSLPTRVRGGSLQTHAFPPLSSEAPQPPAVPGCQVPGPQRCLHPSRGCMPFRCAASIALQPGIYGAHMPLAGAGAEQGVSTLSAYIRPCREMCHDVCWHMVKVTCQQVDTWLSNIPLRTCMASSLSTCHLLVVKGSEAGSGVEAEGKVIVEREGEEGLSGEGDI